MDKRKDLKLNDGTYGIIKPDTPSGHRAAQKRLDLLRKNGKEGVIIYYNPSDPRYLPGSTTYIGPKKK